MKMVSARKIAAYKVGMVVFVVSKDKLPSDVERISLKAAKEFLGKDEYEKAETSARLVASFIPAK